MKTFENIPPIIQDWVEKMHKSTPEHVATNYYTSLKSIVEFINIELKKYDNNVVTKNAAFLKKKKR